MPTVLHALSATAMAITVVTFLPYIRGTLRGGIRPHVFSWVIWSITTSIVAVAQLRAGGGPGAWAIGLSAAITLFITALALLRHGDRAITRIDWCFLAGAFAALPAWAITDDPMWAVLILTAIDLLGFGPTLRKAYADPHHESVLFFAWFILRNALVIAALERWSVTTVAFPLAVGATCVVVVGIIVARRLAVRPST
jgi:hypothetical protein